MPAKSAKQQRFAAMSKHNPEKVRGKPMPKGVATKYAVKPSKGYKKSGRKG